MSDVEIATRDGLVRALTVTIKSQEIQSSFQSKLAKYSQKAKLDGFRPGKVPAKVLEQKFGESIHGEVMQKLMQKHFEKAVKDNAIKVAGIPQLEENNTYKRGEDFTFTTTFEVYPEITLKDFTGVEIEKLLAEVEEDDVKEMLDRLCKQNKTWVPADTDAVSQNDDRVTIDFDGFLDDKPFKGGKAEGYQLILGSHTMIPGFEDGLLNAKVGETRTLTLTFPEEYHGKDLAGKLTRFEVTLQKIEKYQPAELNDSLAKKLDIKGGVEELRTELQKNMIRELKQALTHNLKEKVFAQLVRDNPIDVPQSLIESEIDALVKEYQTRFKTYMNKTNSDDLPPLSRTFFTANAKRRVVLGLLLDALITKYGLKSTPQAVDAKINELAEMYDDTKAVKDYYHNNKDAMALIESLLLEEMITEKLLEQATVTEKKVSYKEVIRLQSPEEHSEEDHVLEEAADAKEINNELSDADKTKRTDSKAD